MTILLRNWCHSNRHFSELAPYHGGKTAGIDMARRNYWLLLILCHRLKCCTMLR